MTERILLDSHAIIWSAQEPERLSPNAVSAMSTLETERLMSVASIWELAIKWRLGKLDLRGLDFADFIVLHTDRLLLTHLPVATRHALHTRTLPLLHGDSFDRLLIAQAVVEGVPIVTADPRFALYGVEVIW